MALRGSGSVDRPAGCSTVKNSLNRRKSVLESNFSRRLQPRSRGFFFEGLRVCSFRLNEGPTYFSVLGVEALRGLGR